jgi:hypothetical protein
LRRLIGDDDHFDESWRKLAPTEADIRKAEQLLANSGPPTGYDVYQFGWLARTAAGDLYGFEVRLDHFGPDDQLAIDTEPLVRTAKLGPRSP